MSNPTKVSGAPAVTAVDIDADLLVGTDVSDETDAPSGTTVRFTPYHLLSSRVPTAAELSGDGTELTQYVQDELGRSRRHGAVELPEGDITYNGTWTIAQRAGFVLRGAGAWKNATYQDPANAWDAVAIARGTRLVYSGPLETDALRLGGVTRARISDFAIEHQNAGRVVVVAQDAAFQSSHLLFENLNVSGDGNRGGVGFEFGAGTGLQSDMAFNRVECRDLDIGMRTNGVQNVVYNWYGASYFTRINTAVHCVLGGGVNLHGVSGNGVGTVIRTDGGGKNARGFSMIGCGWDRTGGPVLPILFDATRVSGHTNFVCDGIDVTWSSEDIDPLHDFWRINSNYNASRVAIRIGTNNLKAMGDDAHRRVGLYTSGGTRTGFVLGNLNLD